MGYMGDSNLDLLALTKTWLCGDGSDEIYIKEMMPSGYKCVHLPRNGIGGGVALVLRTRMFIVVRQRSVFFDSFGCLEVTLTSGSVAHLSIIYRPPPSRVNQSSDGNFLKDFASFLDGHTDTKHLVLVGDFNVHWDVPSHPTVHGLAAPYAG